MRAKCIWNTEDKRPTFFGFLKTHSVTDRITENFDFFLKSTIKICWHKEMK